MTSTDNLSFSPLDVTLAFGIMIVVVTPRSESLLQTLILILKKFLQFLEIVIW
jgi:hypothetical protein